MSSWRGPRAHRSWRTPLCRCCDPHARIESVISEPFTASLADAYAELAGLLLASESFDDLTQQLAVLAANTVPAATTCGITVTADGRVLTAASADGLGRLLDEHQYEIDEGPCLQAIRTATHVSAPDLATEIRWNGYPPRIVAHGIAAVHSAPLMVRGKPLGALNMYSATPHAFDEPAVQDLIRGLANLAAAGMAGALANYDEITLTSRLRRALSTRGVIDQAIGIIIAAQHCTPAEAFDVLRGVSQARNIRLHEIAADLVDRTANGARGDTPPSAPTPTEDAPTTPDHQHQQLGSAGRHRGLQGGRGGRAGL